MPGKLFLDSNIVLYGFSDSEIEKRDRSRSLLMRHHVWISTQVLNECANVWIRKFHQPAAKVRDSLNYLAKVAQVHTIALDDIQRAVQLNDRYGYSFYDSLIVSTALTLGCDTLFTEDMQHGQVIEGVLTILNPFEAA